MKPLYKWPGGKIREINILSQYYPEDFSTYVEPFFGGGAIFFNLEFSSSIINDINYEVVLFLTLIKNGFADKIYEELSKYKNEKDFYYKIRSWKPQKDIEIAARFYYLRKTCFRGLVRYNQKKQFNVPYGNYKKFNFEEILDKKYEELLKNTIILNKPFEYIFDSFNDKKYFYFLDPPYYSTFDKYNSSGFSIEQHELLSHMFKETKSKCLLVIGDSPPIRNFYKDFIVKVYDKKYSITTYSKTIKASSHLVIKNYC